MGMTYFNPFGNEFVIVRFVCNECNADVESEQIKLPSANYSAENSNDSYNCTEDYAVCIECDKEFELFVYVGYIDGYIEVDEIVDDGLIIDEIPEAIDLYYIAQIDSIVNSENIFKHFEENIQKLKSLNNYESHNEIKDKDITETLQKLIFTGIITCLEDYLSTTLIRNVLSNDDIFQKFVKSYKKFKDQKFSLNNIYIKLDEIQNTVKKELLDIIYHNLHIVKEIYKQTLNVEFPDIQELMKIIQQRHDFIHRNGKNKDGEKLELNKEKVDEVFAKVEKFVSEIEENIKIVINY